MPNTKGGKNYKKGKHAPEPELVTKRIPLVGEGTMYVTLVKIMGGNMTEVQDMKGQKYVGVIPGSMRKRVFINPNDILLIQQRKCSTYDDKYDIIYKYSPEEVKYLKSIGHLHFDTEQSEIHFLSDEEAEDDDVVDDGVKSSDVENKAPISVKKSTFDRDKRILILDDL